jgi:hypothetical protein
VLIDCLFLVDVRLTTRLNDISPANKLPSTSTKKNQTIINQLHNNNNNNHQNNNKHYQSIDTADGRLLRIAVEREAVLRVRLTVRFAAKAVDWNLTIVIV